MARGGGRGFSRSGRGQPRGRGSARSSRGGPSRGRARRGGARPANQRNGFITSRVEETEDLSESEQSIPALSALSENEDEDEIHSASEDDAPAPRQSYTTLLQALKSEDSQREPARKRRKLENRLRNDHYDEQGMEDSDAEKDESITIDAGEAHAVLAEDRDNESEDDVNRNDEDESENEDTLSHDPFEQHFAGIEENALKQAISARSNKQTQKRTLGDGSRKLTTLNGDNRVNEAQNKPIKDLHLKGRLQDAGNTVHRALSTEEKDLAAEILNYRDVQYAARTVDNASKLRDLACLHALNHVFKTRDRVLKDNAKLSQQAESDSLDLRDQGFTRPKVLVIVPTKQACVRFMESIIKISEPDQQENKSRFWDTFSQEDDDTLENKTEDFRELFGGNHEEDFRVGLKFTRKTIKYFSGFYNSDIIFGSALGLMRTVTTGGGGKDKKKGHDADFLSSIEMVIVDHAAAIQMQNFQHLEYVFTQLNQLPKDSHGCDFARVRHWYLDGNAKHLRQTILFTPYHTPELNSLLSNHTFNIAGLAKYSPSYTGAMLSLPASLASYTVPQTFLRFDSPSPQNDSDARFKFFTTTILPSLLRHSTKGVLIFIPTYFDFVRLRNHFSTAVETTSLSFGSLSEYTSVRDTARARSHFMNGKHSALIYSERAHHHFRYRIKGVKRIVFYGVPDNPLFWGEIVGLLGLGENLAELEASGTKAGKGLARALFSRWDVLKMERIVGTERVGRLINDRGGDTFEFV